MDLRKTFHPADILCAATLLTRIPLPNNAERFSARGADMAWAFPVVGALLGLLAGIVAGILTALGTGSAIAAVAAIGTLVLITGAMHEDGLADCADGLGGGKTAQERLAIMRDSRIGAFGALALILAVLARWSGMAVLESLPLIAVLAAVGAGSRATMVFAMAAMLNAREDGLSATFGRPQMHIAWAALGVALLIGIAALGFAGVVVFLATMLGAIPLLIRAQTRIGGQTGDVLGGAQQCAEIAGLVAAAIVLT